MMSSSKLIRSLSLNCVKLGTGATAVLTGLGFLAGWNYLGELAVHFTAFYFGLAIFFAILFFCSRAWRWAGISCLLVAVNGVGVVPYYFHRDPIPGRGEQLSVMTANVLVVNTRYQAVADYVHTMQPDVLALEEISDPWLEGLAPLRELYPYRVARPRYDNHGIALFSRIQMEDTSVTELADSGVQEIEATVAVGETKVRVFCVHAVPPRTEAYALARNRMFAALAERVNQWTGPRVVIGDFNNTLWSPHYTRFVRDTGLRNARQGFGILPTWPARMSPFMIPLDHSLHSRDIAVSRCAVGPDIGSDHRPLFVDLVIAKKGQTTN